MANRLCLLSDVRDRIGVEATDTANDDAIRGIIRGVSALFDQVTNRTLLLNASDATETLIPSGDMIHLKRYPIVSVTSVKEALDYDFAAATALTVNTAYRVMNQRGVIFRLSIDWLKKHDSVQVVYKGGYVAPGDTPAASETALPGELREAAIMQSQFILKRRDDIGQTSHSNTGFSVTTFSPMNLLPMVRAILKKHKRWAI